MSSYKLCTQMENEFYIWFIDFISILTAIQKRNLSLNAGWKLRKCVFNDTQESRISSSEAVQPYACLISWPHTLIIQLHWRAGTDFLNVMYLTLFTRCGSVPWKVNRREGTHTHTQHCLNFLICFSLSLSFPEVNELLQSLWLCVTLCRRSCRWSAGPKSTRWLAALLCTLLPVNTSSIFTGAAHVSEASLHNI